MLEYIINRSFAPLRMTSICFVVILSEAKDLNIAFIDNTEWKSKYLKRLSHSSCLQHIQHDAQEVQ